MRFPVVSALAGAVLVHADCTFGSYQCNGSDLQQCAYGANSALSFTTIQTCSNGLVCVVGSYVGCIAATAPSPSVKPSTTSPAVVPPPATSSKPSSSSKPAATTTSKSATLPPTSSSTGSARPSPPSATTSSNTSSSKTTSTSGPTPSGNPCAGIANGITCGDVHTVVQCTNGAVSSTVQACGSTTYCCPGKGYCDFLANCPQVFPPPFPTPALESGKRYKYNSYWGQSSGYFTNNQYQKSLLYYCQTGHYDRIHLAFLATFSPTSATTGFILDLDKNTYGVWDSTGGKAIPPTVVSSFAQVASDVTACQKLGVKVGLSLGGALASINWGNGQSASLISFFQNTFFGGVNSGAVRPFGSVVLDGIDYDDETSVLPVADIVALNQGLKKLNPNMYIGAAPQCPTPDRNIGGVLVAPNNGIDFVQVQFYNNGPCNLVSTTFNFGEWAETIGIPIYVGVPGAPASGNGFADAPTVLGKLNSIAGTVLKPWLRGVMNWDCSSAEDTGFAAGIASGLATLPV